MNGASHRKGSSAGQWEGSHCGWDRNTVKSTLLECLAGGEKKFQSAVNDRPL